MTFPNEVTEYGALADDQKKVLPEAQFNLLYAKGDNGFTLRSAESPKPDDQTPGQPKPGDTPSDQKPDENKTLFQQLKDLFVSDKKKDDDQEPDDEPKPGDKKKKVVKKESGEGDGDPKNDRMDMLEARIARGEIYQRLALVKGLTKLGRELVETQLEGLKPVVNDDGVTMLQNAKGEKITVDKFFETVNARRDLFDTKGDNAVGTKEATKALAGKSKMDILNNTALLKQARMVHGDKLWEHLETLPVGE